MTVASSLWRKTVPKSLLRVYTAWDKKCATGIRTVECPAVQAMLNSIKGAGPLKKCHNRHNTSKATVIPKSSQKCALLFAYVGRNKADGRKPARFQLPQIEKVVRMLATAGPQAYLTKLDIANCFWSIRMPRC